MSWQYMSDETMGPLGANRSSALGPSLPDRAVRAGVSHHLLFLPCSGSFTALGSNRRQKIPCLVPALGSRSSVRRPNDDLPIGGRMSDVRHGDGMLKLQPQ